MTKLMADTVFMYTVPAETLICNSTHKSLMTIQYITMFHTVH